MTDKPAIAAPKPPRNEWTTVRCHNCNGHGIVSDYGLGEDFYGPEECSTCGGSGTLWKSPHNRLAVYPGGEFRGMGS
jgi:hypothetical protein